MELKLLMRTIINCLSSPNYVVFFYLNIMNLYPSPAPFTSDLNQTAEN